MYWYIMSGAQRPEFLSTVIRVTVPHLSGRARIIINRDKLNKVEREISKIFTM